MFHKTLERHLRNHKLSSTELPMDQETWKKFLNKISASLQDDDQVRYLLERSIELSSKEMLERNNMIEQERAKSFHASKMAVLGEMVSGIAHEINTPLGAIAIRAAQAKRAFEKDPTQSEIILKCIDTIEDITQKIAKIITGLLSFSRNEKQDEPVDVFVSAIINDTLILSATKLKQKEIEMKVEQADANLKIKGRSVQIAQVLLNLINNACDAIASEKEKWIKIFAYEENKQIVIGVSDSGPPIPEHIKIKMMQPFFTTKENGKGTGIGLSISKEIIESHNGSLSFAPDFLNTTFLIKLPYKEKEKS